MGQFSKLFFQEQLNDLFVHFKFAIQRYINLVNIFYYDTDPITIKVACLFSKSFIFKRTSKYLAPLCRKEKTQISQQSGSLQRFGGSPPHRPYARYYSDHSRLPTSIRLAISAPYERRLVLPEPLVDLRPFSVKETQRGACNQLSLSEELAKSGLSNLCRRSQRPLRGEASRLARGGNDSTPPAAW